MTSVARRPARPLRVLLVDDDASDGGFTREVLARAAAPNAVTAVARVGDAAARLVRDAGATAADLVLVHATAAAAGREALVALKSDPALQHVPVLVLAAGDVSAADLLSFYRLHASCCLRAPADRAALAALLQAVIRYWLGGQVLLPARPAAPPP